MASETDQNSIEQNISNKNNTLKYLVITFIFILLITILSFTSYKLFFSNSQNEKGSFNNSINTPPMIPETVEISSPADAALNTSTENNSAIVQPNTTIVSPIIENNSTDVIIPETVEISSPADAALNTSAENNSVRTIPPTVGVSSPADAALNTSE